MRGERKGVSSEGVVRRRVASGKRGGERVVSERGVSAEREGSEREEERGD